MLKFLSLLALNFTLTIPAARAEPRDLCHRSAVFQAQVKRFVGEPCENVSAKDLAQLTILEMGGPVHFDFLRLEASDFEGLDGLRELEIRNSGHGVLPEGLLNFPNLERLSLAGFPDVQNLSTKDFQLLPKLRELSLEGFSGVQSLPADLLANLANLTSLTLAGFSLAEIPHDLLARNAGLQNLVLTQLSPKGTLELPVDFLKPAKQLTEVRLGNLALRAGVFSGMGPFKELYLYSDGISPGSFTGIGSVATLIFSGDTPLVPGIFGGLERLNTLWFLFAKLGDVPNGIFADLKTLETLQFNDGGVQSFAADAFQGLTELTDFEIIWNKIPGAQLLRSGMLAGSPKLKTFALTNSQVTQLPKGFTRGLTNLDTLDLKSNLVTNIEVGTFVDLRAIQVLNLWDNQISKVEDGALDPSVVPLGVFVDLRQNQLSRASRDKLRALRDGNTALEGH